MSTEIELKSFKINTKIEILTIKSNYYPKMGGGCEENQIDLKINY